MLRRLIIELKNAPGICVGCSTTLSRKPRNPHFEKFLSTRGFKLSVPTCRYSSSFRKVKVAEDPETLSETLTSEEEVTILKLVNEVQRSEDLLKFLIPKKKADELVKRKTGSGDIVSIDDVVSIVGVKNVSKFFCSVLEKPIPVSVNSAIFPIITTEQMKCIESVLSLIIVGDRISWIVLNRIRKAEDISLEVKSWHQINYQFKPRMHFVTLLKEMEKVTKDIPGSDLCLFEEYPATAPTPYMYNFHLQMAQAKSMIVGILSSRTNPPIISSLKTVSVARLFNTYIGSEKVSGQHIVDNMLLDKKLPYVNVPEEILSSYSSADSKVKEGLSQAFLTNLAYWKMTKQIGS